MSTDRFVKLRNGGLVPRDKSHQIMVTLFTMWKRGLLERLAIYELYLHARDSDYVIPRREMEILWDNDLFDEEGVKEYVKEVILSAAVGEGGEFNLRDAVQK